MTALTELLAVAAAFVSVTSSPDVLKTNGDAANRNANRIPQTVTTCRRHDLPPVWNNIIKKRLTKNGAGTTTGGVARSEEFCYRSSLSPTPSGDDVTWTKAAATAESSLSAVICFHILSYRVAVCEE